MPVAHSRVQSNLHDLLLIGNEQAPLTQNKINEGHSASDLGKYCWTGGCKLPSVKC